MNRRDFGKSVLVLASSRLGGVARAEQSGAFVIKAQKLQCTIDPTSGQVLQMESRVGRSGHAWLKKPVSIQVRNEVTGASTEPVSLSVVSKSGRITRKKSRGKAPVTVSQRWMSTRYGLRWELSFDGNLGEGAHEIIVEFPILEKTHQLFTPTERGVMSVDAYPAFQATPYASSAWKTHRYYVLPLISAWDANTDQGITIALSPEQNIPHLQFEWVDQSIVRVHLGHRDLRAARPKPVSLVLYAHPADYRSVVHSYSSDFPRYFKPALPRGKSEGAFYYHHIQDHPSFEEMARQGVRYIWSSFWFKFVGDYMPAEKEWYPYTYAKWWNLHQMIGDEKIRAFITEMREHGIGTYGYFNFTEFGGPGGQQGTKAEADRILDQKFQDCLVQDAPGHTVTSWQGTKVVNPGPRYSYFPFNMEQLRRYITRLPQLDGYCIDRLDWGSTFDYAHQDGVSMIGKNGVENLATPVAYALAEMCRLAHAAKQRVFVNQFWRVELIKDVDGYCHEYDFPRGLGYVSPFRPVSAWEYPDPYLKSWPTFETTTATVSEHPNLTADDLMPFEAKVKERLQFAVFPQMIAHTFPICQQWPSPRAADLLEMYTPLFNLLLGKEQVLLPHCVGVTGPNEANLFTNPEGHYVAPVTSRLNFATGAHGKPEKAVLTLRVPDYAELQWAHIYSVDTQPARASLYHHRQAAQVMLPSHLTASVVVVGKGAEPPLQSAHPTASDSNRASSPPASQFCGTSFPERAAVDGDGLIVRGRHMGPESTVAVMANGERLVEMPKQPGIFYAPAGRIPQKPVCLEIIAGDEGTWFVPARIEFRGKTSDGQNYSRMCWTPEKGVDPTSSPGRLKINLVL